MSKKFNNQLPLLYTSVAFITGISLLILSYLIEAYWSKLPFSPSTLVTIHQNSPTLFLLDTLILAGVVLSYFAGRYFNMKMRETFAEVEVQRSSINKVLGFAERLRDGDISKDYTLENSDDSLGRTLVELRDQLAKNKEEEAIRKKEEDQRHWVATGIAQFGDILQHNTSKIQVLAQNIVSFLVKYMNVNQAGFYNLVHNENERYFDLVAIYAFGRNKFPDQRVEWGEGIVGAVAQEKDTVYMTEVPDSYITITSGLGESNPRSILVVPLQNNDEVHGVLELASFDELDEYKIRFVERIAENIASTLAGVKINEQTGQLLQESQETAMKMAETEEFMRQNMEELEATQLEAAAQSEEFISFSNSVNLSMLRAEFDLDGNLLIANDKFRNTLQLAVNPTDKIHISNIIDKRKLEWFERYWMEITTKRTHFEGEIPFVTSEYKQVWTVAAFSSITNLEDEIEKVLFLGIDVTEQKATEQQNRAVIETINLATLKFELNLDGEITLSNERIMKLLRFSQDEIRTRGVKDFILEDKKRNFRNIWQNITRGIPFEGRIGMVNKLDEKSWFYGTFSLINSISNQASEKIVFIGSDITRQVEMEEKSKLQTKKLIEQEEQLRSSREDLSRRLREAKEEMREQYKEIEIVKSLNEKTLEGTLDAIVSINQFGKIEFFNEAAEELWGLSKEQVLGGQIEEILPIELEADEEEYMGKYLKISDSPSLRQRIEVFFVTHLGQRENVLLTLSESKEGEHYRLTGFIQKVEVELF